MPFNLDKHSRLPYPAQVQRQAAAQLVAGRLQPGDRLPSVRQLARELDVSRTTAERIQDALCDALLAEVRPRSGVFVASPDTRGPAEQIEWAHRVYAFLRQAADRGRELGLTVSRLAHLLDSLDDSAHATTRPALRLSILATRDAFECMTACLPADFPIDLHHLPPSARQSDLPPCTRYLLCGYYLRGRARRLAEMAGCALVFVRYNVRLLDEAMAVPEGEHRHFVTRDADNAETTRGLLASAYPEIPATRYTVAPVDEWLERHAARASGQVWATITAAAALKTNVPIHRLHVMHPMLPDDFLEDLRCLALLA